MPDIQMIKFSKKIWFFMLLWVTSLFSSGQNTSMEDDSIRAVALFRQAVEYGRNMEPEKALDYFGQSLVFRKKLFGERHYRLGSTYMGMAIQYKNLFQLENAYRYYKIAEEMYLHNAPPGDSRIGDIYTNIGNYYRLKGDYSEAIRFHQRALDIYENATDNPSYGSILSANYNLAECYHLSNQPEEALDILENFAEKGSLQQRIQFQNLIASIYTSSGNLEKSKSIFHSLLRSIKEEYGEDAYNLADQYTTHGQFYMNALLPDSALFYYYQAESIYSMYDNTERDLSELYFNIANALTAQPVSSASVAAFKQKKSRNLQDALKYLEKALILINDSINVDNPDISQLESSNAPVIVLRLLNARGSVFQQLAEQNKDLFPDRYLVFLTQAVNTFHLASDLAVKIRTSFISQESKLQFAELQRYIFASAVMAGYDLYNLTRDARWFGIAFRNAGRSKAAGLYDNLAELQARRMNLIPDSLSDLEERYNGNVAYYRERLFEESRSGNPDSEKMEEYKESIFLYEQKRNDLIELLEKRYPDYYEMKYSVKEMSLAEVQKKLKRDEALLEFVLTKENEGILVPNIYTFTISKNGYQIRKETLTTSLLQAVSTVYGNISSTAFLNSGVADFREYCMAAYTLYEKLIKPSEELIRNKRLTIIPDGILNYIPFEALLTNMPETGRIHYHDLPYLILNYPVNYASSAELYIRDSSSPLFRRKRTFAAAPDYSLARYTDEKYRELAVIPGILDEVAFLASAVSADIHTGKNATEKLFREKSGSYDILHLSMHTLINDSLPLFSRLAFHPDQPDDILNDGWLNTSDIYNLSLKAYLTVLSACNTGKGQLSGGEGVMSLARAFLYAGCPSVIMTLWDIEDRSGTAIMKDFYRYLKAGKTKDVALRQAKLKHIQNADPLMSHPHFWMGYISIGKTDALYIGNELYFFLAILVVGLILGADFTIRKKARRRQA